MKGHLFKLLLVGMLALSSLAISPAGASSEGGGQEGAPEDGTTCSFCAPVCPADLVSFCTARGCWNEQGSITCQTTPCTGGAGIWPARVICTTS
jgi:hypothetical protein